MSIPRMDDIAIGVPGLYVYGPNSGDRSIFVEG
jgi:hypothetical protein